MNQVTAEWVAKAERDSISALRERRARKDPNYDSACFHAQQCAEKYLKACLQDSSIVFDRTHNLVTLLDPLVMQDATWDVLRPELQTLTQYAVDLRYPGKDADQAMAVEAIAIARKVRAKARVTPSLPP